MIPRSIRMIAVLLALFFVVLWAQHETYPNNLPNRWDFPAPFQFTVTMKESPPLLEIRMKLTITRISDNTPILFPQTKQIERQCGIWRNHLPFAWGSVYNEDRETLGIEVSHRSRDGTPSRVFQFTVLCDGISIGRPKEPDTPSETDVVMAVSVIDNDRKRTVLQTDHFDLTIRDFPSMSHHYKWGGKKENSAEVLVTFGLYVPKALSPLIPHIDLDHPLLDVNRIDSMHLPSTANRLDDLTRPYNILQDSKVFASFFPCRTMDQDTCASIEFIRSDSSGKVVPRVTVTNRDNPSCVCWFQVPYPPDVVHSILGPSQSKQVHMLVDDPDSKERVTIASISIDYPRMIIGKYIHLGHQPYIWHSAMHSRNGVTEFELGFATTDRDQKRSDAEWPMRGIGFQIRNSVAEFGKQEYKLNNWSPVIACRQHDTLEYPDDIPVKGGKFEVTLSEFGAFGKTCRIRLLKPPTETRSSWWLYSYAIPYESRAPSITIFNSMHQLDMRESLQNWIQLYDAQDSNRPTDDDALPPKLFLSPDDMQGLQPIPFTRYTRESDVHIEHHARATIDIKLLLPYPQRFSPDGVMLAIIFAGRNTIENGVLPASTTDQAFFIDTKRIAKLTKVNWKAYSYNFHGVLDTQHCDPIGTVLQHGRPLRAPVVGLDPGALGIKFYTNDTVRVTIDFMIDKAFDVENEPIYIALSSQFDLQAGRFPTQYAHITPATHQLSAGQIVGIVIGSLIAGAILLGIALCILRCRRQQKACFRRRVHFHERYCVEDTSNLDYQHLEGMDSP